MEVNGRGENLTPATQKHLNRWSPKFVYVTTSGISTITQNFNQIGLGVSVLRMRDFAPLGKKWLGYCFWFLRKATAETRAPILTQNTSNDAVSRKEVPCLLGVAKPKSKVSTPIFPKKRHFWAPFRRDLKIFRPKTALTLDGSRVNDP